MANIKSFPNNQDEYIGAQDVMRWLHGRTSGVFGAENNAAVAPVLDTMFVTVSDGNGWMSNENADGIVWWINNEAENGAKLQLSVDMADAVLPRIDRVVVSWQTTNYVALPEVIILKGVPETYPAAPELTNNNLVRQISLAAIHVPAGATAISALNITDERLNPDVCGIVTERIGIDTSMAHEQYLAAVEELRSAISQMWNGVIPDGSITQQMLDPNIKLGSNDIYVGGEEPTGEDRPKLWIDPTDNREIVIPRNLLDNSDFTNPVNQRGQTSYVVPGEHTIDRWMSNGTVEIVDGGIRVSSGVFRQRIENLDVNKTYTLAAEDTSGDVHVVTGVPQNGAFNDGADFELCVRIGADHVVVGLKSGLAYKWAALYEGEYTAETLPPYVAKGYGAELLECQRYYQKYQMLVGAASGWSLNRIYVNVRPVMRIKPTATVNHTGTGTPSVYVRADQTLDITCSSGYADTNIALSADL